MTQLGIVVIGRNEGPRLGTCLSSLDGVDAQVVYVDSGSTDNSVSMARDHGAAVVELSGDRPFTAARARAAGFDALARNGEPPEFVQFIDGDCALVGGWIDAALAELETTPSLGLVTGWRREVSPGATIFNAMCAVEWHRPPGEIDACGGDMMVRASAYASAGGFNPEVIAAEDDEFCRRLAKAGWRLRRIPRDMTLHDADMTRFGQWWRRAVRSGHGFAQVGHLHPEYFRRERLRTWVFAALLPMLLVAGAAFGQLWLVVLVFALYALSFFRSATGLRRMGFRWKDAAHQALYITLSKFPNLLGMITYHVRRLRHRPMRIIEYK